MKQQTKKNLSVSDIGKIQPQARELEQAVLGAILIESTAYDTIDSILSASDFYDNIHQIIFQSIQNLKNIHRPIDMLTVVEQLRKDGELEVIGGPVYISQLTEKVASSAHIEYHARIIRQKAMARQLISMCSTIQELAFDDTSDISDVMEIAEKKLTDITTGSESGNEVVDMVTALKRTIDYAQKIQTDAANGRLNSIPTGLKRLDIELLGGWKSPDFIILGGRPSMGKTQFAVHFAKAAGQSGNDCLFISIEMTMIQLINRMILENNAIDFYKLRTGQLSSQEWELIDVMVKILYDLKINIADGHGIRYLSNIKSLARRMHRKGNLKIMIIDYLQLIRTNMKFGTRDQEIGYITSELKNLAKELNIPIIALAQVSRPPKGMKVGKPKLDDLRESGNIEQDADIVIFPHRPSYYDEEDTEWKNRGGLIIAKHREGEKDATVLFQHDDRFKKIWDDGEDPSEVYHTEEYRQITPNYDFINQGDSTPF